MDPDTPRDPIKVTINEAEAAVVREMFAFYLQEGTSLMEWFNICTRWAFLPHGKVNIGVQRR
jgi:hypothetical protein